MVALLATISQMTKRVLFVQISLQTVVPAMRHTVVLCVRMGSIFQELPAFLVKRIAFPAKALISVLALLMATIFNMTQKIS